MELVEAFAGQATCLARWADAGTEEALVRIDVADAVEQRLVEERSFDGELAPVEEGGEGWFSDGEGFAAGSGEGFGDEGKSPEAAGVDEAKLATGSERQDGVGVGRLGDAAVGDEEAPGHAEVDQPLRVGRRSFA